MGTTVVFNIQVSMALTGTYTIRALDGASRRQPDISGCEARCLLSRRPPPNLLMFVLQPRYMILVRDASLDEEGFWLSGVRTHEKSAAEGT